MLAAICEHYGSPEAVQVKEILTPEPKDDEVLLKVYASTVSSGDWRMRSGVFPPGFKVVGRLAMGVFRPRHRCFGNDLCGVVEKVGRKVTQFEPGQDVIAQCGASLGAHAEYKVLPASGVIARKPANLTFVQAGAMGFGGGTALNFLKRAKIKPGDHLLVNGASGSVGSAMVQLAKHLGAEVTGVCSEKNTAFVRALGADHTIDYAKEDFTQSGQTYDIVADTAGTAPFHRVEGSIKSGGSMLAILGSLGELLKARGQTRRTGKTVIAGPAEESSENLEALAQIAEAGGFTPHVDKVFALAEIVEAHRIVDSGHKRGNVVVVMPDAPSFPVEDQKDV